MIAMQIRRALLVFVINKIQIGKEVKPEFIKMG